MHILCEEFHGLASRNRRLDRLQQVSHHMVESRLLDRPETDFLVVVPFGYTSELKAEQVHLDVFAPAKILTVPRPS